VVLAATGYKGVGPNPHIDIALGGIVAAGVLYLLIGLIVWRADKEGLWVRRFIPEVVTGAIVAIIGLNLASLAVQQVSTSVFDTFIGLTTAFLVVVFSVVFPIGTLWQKISLLIGGAVSYAIYFIVSWNPSRILELGGDPIDLSTLEQARWLGLPTVNLPSFNFSAVILIAPVAIILVAENLGHVKAISSMTGRKLDQYLGRAFIADGLATTLSGFFGGTGVTTYAENIGVMNITKNYSSYTCLVAGIFAVCFGLSPKVGAAIHSIPEPIIGGLSFVLFGTITAAAGRIWVDAKVDFNEPKNSLPAGVALIMGAGNFTLRYRAWVFGGIATATFSAIILYHLLNKITFKSRHN
jgi:putative pyrimidine permease RutG